MSIQVTNTLYNTKPIVIHAHGSHDYKPNWPPIRNAFFSSTPCKFNTPVDLTIITCNNGHEAMGIFERSLDHLGLTYEVYGQGIYPWINAVNKPRVLYEGLCRIQTRYVLYADSRDAILLNDPEQALNIFCQKFQCKLLFGADKINWPPIREFQVYEDRLSANKNTDLKYFNGGAWIGETLFCRDFFERAMNTPPHDKAPESEQGILKKLFPFYEGEILLDYHCEIIQNIGFVSAPVFTITSPSTSALENE